VIEFRSIALLQVPPLGLQSGGIAANAASPFLN
jgi:hypothetical protein